MNESTHYIKRYVLFYVVWCIPLLLGHSYGSHELSSLSIPIVTLAATMGTVYGNEPHEYGKDDPL